MEKISKLLNSPKDQSSRSKDKKEKHDKKEKSDKKEKHDKKEKSDKKVKKSKSKEKANEEQNKETEQETNSSTNRKERKNKTKEAIVDLNKLVLIIQSTYRMHLCRKRYLKIKNSAMAIQDALRCSKAILQFKEMRKMVKLRKNLLNEIAASEKTYTEALRTLVEVYLKPMLQKNLLTQDDAHNIFSNLDYKIAKIHVKFMQDLLQRMEEWNQITNPHSQFVGDIFLDFIDEFKSYRHYITNYNQSIETLTKLSASPFVSQFLKEAKLDPRCNLRGVSDFLIMPIQRLPRYELLLTDLLRCTDVQSKDYGDIKTALGELKQVTNFINELKRHNDSKKRMMTVESKVIGTSKPISLVQEGRLLIREGNLTQITREGTESEMYVFLFSDIIMASRPTNVRKNIIDRTLRYNHDKTFPLEGLTVLDMSSESGLPPSMRELCFRVVTADGKTVFWKAQNVPLKNSWLNDINNAIKNLSA